jgi:hypothetical protein
MIQVVPKAPSFSNDCIRTSVVIQKTPDIMWAFTICIRTCGGGDLECISVLFYKHGEDITMWVIIIALILGFFLSIFDSAKRY